MPDWNDLRHFLAVARSGTLAGAARTLKVAETTVGRRLQCLESSLGARLFDRTPEGYALTAAGEQMQPMAEQVESQMTDLERRVSGEDTRLAGPVRLAISESSAIGYLLPRLQPLLRRHPQLTVELFTGNVSANLLKREADLAIRVGVRPTQKDLLARKVAEIGLTVYGSRKRFPACRPTELARAPWIGFDSELTGIAADRWIASQIAPSQVAVRSNSYLAIAAACVAGLGLALLPCFVADQQLSLRRIVDPPALCSDMWLVVHPDLARSARVRALADFIVERMTADADLLSGRQFSMRPMRPARKSRTA